MAHATGKTGRFTLIERWRNNERLLAPQEHPLKVIIDYSSRSRFEAAFICNVELKNTARPAKKKQITKPLTRNKHLSLLYFNLYILIRNEKHFFILRNFNARKIRQINIEALDNKVKRVGSVTFCDPFIQKT